MYTKRLDASSENQTKHHAFLFWVAIKEKIRKKTAKFNNEN
jgi:hypothetical protein